MKDRVITSSHIMIGSGLDVITVLLNSAARAAGRADPGVIENLFRMAGGDARIELLRSGQDPVEAVRAAAKNRSTVVAAGGDGTVNAVAAALAGTDRTLGVLPLGTLNHFAKDLRIPLDLEKAVATIVTGRVDAVDVGRVKRQGHRKWPAFVLATARVLRSSNACGPSFTCRIFISAVSIER